MRGNIRNRNLRPNNLGIVDDDQNEDQNIVLQGFDMFYNAVNLLLRLIYFLFLSIHHDWIDPVLRRYDQDHAVVQRAHEAINQMRDRERAIDEANERLDREREAAAAADAAG